MQDFNHSRLTLARRRRGLTKTALAKAVGLSTRMVVGYERGDHEPSDKTRGRLVDVLLFPDAFFDGPDLDEPPLDGSSFRALTTLTARQRDQSLAAGAIAFALSDWIQEKFVLPEPDVPRLQGVSEEMAADAVRAEWGLGEKPIPNMIHLLEAHGVRVFSVAEDCHAMDAFSCWRRGTPYVFLNTFKSAERSRMDAAHELGHLVLHWAGGARGRDAEREAERFGSAFLMPEGSIRAEAPRSGRLDQFIKAKRHWNVSLAGLTYRMHALHLLSDWQYRSLFVEMSSNGYRTREPNGSRPETSQLLAKVMKALREEGITMNELAEELTICPDELNKLVFGLVLTVVV